MAFTLVGGYSNTFRTLCVARFFAGAFGSPVAAVFAGVLNDIWDVPREALGNQMIVLYGAVAVLAPFVAPLIGGAMIDDTGNWRWTFYFQAILLGATFLFNVFTPETFRPTLLAKYHPGTKNIPRITWRDAIRVGFGRPLNMLIRDPINLPTCVIGAFYQAVLYVYYVAYPILFEGEYHFTVYHTGLTFLPLLVGGLIGILLMGILDKRVYMPRKLKAEAQGLPVQPELRLIPGMVGSFIYRGPRKRQKLHYDFRPPFEHFLNLR